MQTIMVVGASGFLGSSIVDYFRKKYKVIAMFRKQMIRFEGASHFVFAFEDRDYMKRLATILKPDTIIYAAGLTDMLECHKKQNVADTANSLGPIAFMDAAETITHRFIYLSTPYVYDGRKGSYGETDVTLPETAYGKTKLAGENYVRNKAPIHTVFRLSPIYGVGSIYHPSLFDRMRIELSQGKRFELPDNEHHSFLCSDIFLKAIEWSMFNDSQNETYNLGGLTKVSTYQFGVELAKKLGLDHNLLTPTKGMFQDSNFLDFSLNGSKFVKASQINPLVLEEGLNLFKKLLIC